MADRVRVASVGIGWWSNMLADHVQKGRKLQIVRCYTRSPEKRRAFAEKYGCREAESYEAILKDPEVEAVLLTTPHSLHAPQVIQAAEAGKHVFVEKPLTLDAREGARAAEACRRAGVKLSVGHHRRRQAANRRIKQMIGAGELGMVHQAEANLSVPGGQTPRVGSWRNDPRESPAGAMTGLGVHMVDTLYYFLGPAKRLAAFSKRLLARGPLDDVTGFIVEYESGPVGYIGTCYVAPKLCQVSVYGTEANAFSDEEGSKLYFQKKGEETRATLPVEAVNPFIEELDEFGRCIRDGGEPETGAESSLEVVAVLQAVIESAQSGRVVELSEFRP